MIQNLIKATAKIKEVVIKASEMANLKIKYVNVGIAGKHIRSFSTHHSIGLQNNENEPIEINTSHVRKLEQRSKWQLFLPIIRLFIVCLKNIQLMRTMSL